MSSAVSEYSSGFFLLSTAGWPNRLLLPLVPALRPPLLLLLLLLLLPDGATGGGAAFLTRFRGNAELLLLVFWPLEPLLWLDLLPCCTLGCMVL